MANEKLTISAKKYSGESSVISVRLPNELISEIDEISEKTARTRNEIIQKCLIFATENLEVK